jgi:F-type H+-transporting ATPase subunit epsilon
MPLSVQVVSPERILWSGEASMVLTRTSSGGDIAFMTGHAPFVGALGIGVTRIQPVEGEEVAVAVHGGFVEVSANQVSILSDVAELGTDVDIQRAVDAYDRAEAALKEGPSPEAEEALTRANARLNAVGDERTTPSH